MPYNPIETEKKWQEIWKESLLYHTDLTKTDNKYYNLVMFPYPSGDKLHIGHWYSYAPADSWGRYMRMNGRNVFEPIGFDSFGLPAENYAIKTGVHPKESIKKNVEYMRGQLRAMGTMYDWSREVVTSSPEYYKWTQWMFLQLYKRKLAYRAKAPVNWCPKCATVLANEQAQEGTCERCDTPVEKKDLTQWFFRLSDYAERLLNFSGLDWPEKTITMQTNWIGKSEGVIFNQKVKRMDMEFESFDSVPQTFIAQTFAVIAPEHPRLQEMVKGTEHEKPVMDFVKKIKQKKMKDRFNIEEDIEGVFTGRYVDNPFGTGDLPIWVASFVLEDYGSGVVNCSVHDERDFAFAKKYGIPLKPVMVPSDKREAEKVKNLEYCYHHDSEGILLEPAEFKGRKWGEAREDVIKYIGKKGFGKKTIQYRLKDWLLSRQRYWGAPIPIVYCEKCGEVAVPEENLPVLLPENVDFKPRGDGRSPLAKASDFVNTVCPNCGGKALRETDTMDTFVCSSWYFLRYLSSGYKDGPFDKKLIEKWLPVDMYVGGAEHACMHLIYARFLTMALYDAGILPFQEPFKKLIHQGMITKDGAKMSKSKGNVVSPDDFVSKYGSDVFRMYLMFMGPFTEGGDFSDQGITGISRFLDKLWNLLVKKESINSVSKEVEQNLHKTIKKVGEDIENFHFNTAIAALMEFTNFAKDGLDLASKKTVALLIAPIAPHFAEELFEKLGEKDSIFKANWPKYLEKLLQVAEIEIAVQVNGALRATIKMGVEASQAEVISEAKKQKNVQVHLEGKNIVKEIYIPGKIVNIVAK